MFFVDLRCGFGIQKHPGVSAGVWCDYYNGQQKQISFCYKSSYCCVTTARRSKSTWCDALEGRKRYLGDEKGSAVVTLKLSIILCLTTSYAAYGCSRKALILL